MWKMAERQIFKVEIAGVELAFDPVRCLIRYQKAVKTKGGHGAYKEVWDRYHKPRLKQDAADPATEEFQQHLLQEAEDTLFLAEIGAAIVDMPLFGTVDDPHRETDGKVTLTAVEGRDMLYAYLEFATKKESGEEKSTSASGQDSPPSEETAKAIPATVTT